MSVHANYIAGSWVEGPDAAKNVNPSDLSDVVGEYSRADRAQAEQAIAAARAAFPKWSMTDAAGAARPARQDRQHHPGAEGGAGPAAVARGGQDPARGHRRGRPRRPDLQVLRRRGAAHPGREAGLGPPRHRCRDHPRADRRHRPDHAVELPDRDPGLEDRAGAGLRQLRRVQAGRPGAGQRLGAGRDHRRCRRARRRVQPGDGPRLGGRRGLRRQQGCRRHHLHRLGRHRPQHRRCAAPSWARRSSSRWAARTRWSSSTTPISNTAVGAAANGAFFSTGQRCTASSRLIVTEGIHDRFVAAMTEKLKALKVDNALKQGTEIGPGGRPEPARPGPVLHRHRRQGRRQAGVRRRAAEPRDRGLLPVRRRCSPRPPTTCGSTARRSSGRSPR